MKKFLVLLTAAILVLGCDDPESTSVSYPRIRGVWNLNLQPTAAPQAEYTVAVEVPGGSGAARVYINGPGTANGATVTADAPVPLGSCGLDVVFGATAGFNLAAGDFWQITVSGGEPRLPLPGNTVDSIVGGVTAGGTYTCAPASCDGSALASALPFVSPLGTGAPAGGQWLSVRMRQNGPNVTASIPEEHVLEANLGANPFALLPPLASPGDSVTLSYRRALAADGENGDFFRVLITNGSDYLTPEYRQGPDMTSGDTAVTITFTAASANIIIDFIGGLSSPGETITLDAVSITSSGGGSLIQDFETGPTGTCSPVWPAASRIYLRKPAWRGGDVCVSSISALAGTYSLRWIGGSYRDFSGSIISGAATSSILSIIGLGGGDVAGFSGVFGQTYEPDLTDFLTTFALVQQARGNLVGTFKGEARPPACVEDGQITATLQRGSETDVSSAFWIIRLEGSSDDCLPSLAVGDSIMFGDTLSTSSGDTLAVIQIGSLFIGQESLADDHANAYSINGIVSGALVTFTLSDTLGRASANAIGVAGTDNFQGALTGSLVFAGGQVCNLRESTFEVTLQPKAP